MPAVDLAGLAPSGSLAPAEWVRLPPGPSNRPAPAAGWASADGFETERSRGGRRSWPCGRLLERDVVTGVGEHSEDFLGVRGAARLERQLDASLAHVQRHRLADVV